MRKLHRTIAQAIARRFGYTIQGQGFAKQHHTITRAEALQWLACYDAATITRRGRFIAARTTN